MSIILAFYFGLIGCLSQQRGNSCQLKKYALVALIIMAVALPALMVSLTIDAINYVDYTSCNPVTDVINHYARLIISILCIIFPFAHYVALVKSAPERLLNAATPISKGTLVFSIISAVLFVIPLIYWGIISIIWYTLPNPNNAHLDWSVGVALFCLFVGYVWSTSVVLRKTPVLSSRIFNYCALCLAVIIFIVGLVLFDKEETGQIGYYMLCTSWFVQLLSWFVNLVQIFTSYQTQHSNNIMKDQQLLRLSAIGLWIYAAAMLVRKVLSLTNNWWTIFDLTGHEIFTYSFTTIAIVSMVVAFFTIYRMRDHMPKVDTTTRILLHLVGWTTVICTCDILIDTFLSFSCWFIHIDILIPICLSLVSGIILWRISSQTGVETLPKGLPIVLKMAGIVNCAVILLIVVAALYVVFTDHVFGFRTYNWITLVSFLTASIVLPWLAIGR